MYQTKLVRRHRAISCAPTGLHALANVRPHTYNHRKDDKSPILVGSATISASEKVTDAVPGSNRKWIGVDLDNTLAEMKDWKGPLVIGKPIQKIVNHVKALFKAGKVVKIFTARIAKKNQLHDVPVEKITKKIQDFTEKLFGKRLEVTCVKDPNCEMIIDDKALNPKDIKAMFAGGPGSGRHKEGEHSDAKVLPRYQLFNSIESLKNRIKIIKERGSKNDQKEIPHIKQEIERRKTEPVYTCKNCGTGNYQKDLDKGWGVDNCKECGADKYDSIKASIDIQAFIRKEGSQHCVKSEKGKNLGCYSSEGEAKKRLQQVEYFKHKNQMDAGGPGSGCHGPNCGRPTTNAKGEKYVKVFKTVPGYALTKMGSGYVVHTTHNGKPIDKDFYKSFAKSKAEAKQMAKDHAAGNKTPAAKTSKPAPKREAEEKPKYTKTYTPPTKISTKDIESAVNKFSSKYGADKLKMKEDIASDWKSAIGWTLKSNSHPDDIAKEVHPLAGLYAQLGLGPKDLQKFEDTIQDWLGEANQKFADVAQKVLDGKLTDNLTKSMAIEKAITARVLGKTEFTLYRGVDQEYVNKGINKALNTGKPIELQTRGADSWSDSKDDASNFGDVMLKSSFKADNVITCWKSNHIVRDMDEKEFIVAYKGGKVPIKKGGLVQDSYWAGKEKPIVIDVTDDKNANWLHSKRKKKVAAGGPGSGRHKTTEKDVAKKALDKEWDKQTRDERIAIAHNNPNQERLFKGSGSKNTLEKEKNK